MTLDDFDTKLKELLKEAGNSGIEVETIRAQYFGMLHSGKEKYVLDKYEVEYSRRG